MSELKSCPFCGGEAAMQAPNMHRKTCVVCKECGVSTGWGAVDTITSVWNHRAQPASETLTLEQLRDMGGEPVWCVYPGCSTGGEWFLVNSQGACKNCSFLNFRYYGEWLAYRRPLERSKDNA